MHKTKFFFITLLLLPLLHLDAQTPDNSPTFINSPTANPNVTNAPVYNVEIKPQFITNTTAVINAIGVQIKDVTLKIIDKAEKTFTKDNYHHAKDALKQLMWEYRYKIAASVTATTYSIITIMLIADYYYLKDTERWSQWKSDSTFEYLCSLSQAELSQELVRAIGEHHYNKKNPNDSSHPLITFIAAIETEINTCKRYLMLTKMIKFLHLMIIFPTNDAKIAQVNRYLERCLFIKHIFLSWLTERNLITKALKSCKFL